MPRVIPQKVSHLKENNENSNINMQDTQHKMIARLLKNNAIPHFQTQMDMKELNVYYRFYYFRKVCFHDKLKIATIMLK